MASALGNWGENWLLNHMTGASSVSLSGNSLWVALFSASPDETMVTTNEIAGGGYTRQEVVFPVSAGSTCATTGALTWSPTASWNISGVGLYTSHDTATASGIMFGDLTTAKSVGSSDTFTIDIGNLTVSLA